MTPAARRYHLAVDVALAWLLLWLGYRAGLQVTLQSTMGWAGGWQDVLWALTLALFAALIGWRWQWLGALANVPLLAFCALNARAYQVLLAAMHQGIDRLWVRNAWLSGELLAVDANTQPRDVALIVSPALLFLLLRLLPLGRQRLRPRLVFAFATALLIAVPLAAPRGRDWPVDAIHNPTAHLLLTTPSLEEEGFALPSPPQRPPPVAVQLPAAATALVLAEASTPSERALRFDDPRLAAPGPVRKELPPAGSVAWNIVWIIMESTGTRYVEGETFPHKPPMPTLQRLAAEGWYLARHQSPSNSSATSIFAQFTGLLPSPQMQMFSIRPDNHIPALPWFLPDRYEKFLYTPGKLSYFFPKPLLQHSGLGELVGFDESPVTHNPGGEGLSKDEIEVMSTFLARLQRAREPFLGVYYSYAPHWPYTDYGPTWRRYGGARLIDHYHDNLWLLDNQITRVIEQLRADGRLDRTILVLAGDHGEAFGQHERNWAHARGSFRENFETPAVIWQPRLFAPRRIEAPTQHVDLLPTLLDALGIPYDEALFQGESLFQERLRRTVQFFWANEGTVTALRQDGVKMSWTPLDKRCRIMDLRDDPLERHPRTCQAEPELLEILKTFRDDQRLRLEAYSAAVRRGEAFFGHRHPLPGRYLPQKL